MPYVSTTNVRTYRVTTGPDGTRTTMTSSTTGTRDPHQRAPAASTGKQPSSTPRGNQKQATSHKPSHVGAAVEGDYNKLSQQLKGSGKLWEDPDFPASDESLFLHAPRGSSGIEWKRVSEISQSPQFITGGASRFDVQQGELGDCWLLAAVASLSLNKELFNQVVPPDQSFGSGYFGAIRFRFWRFGQWEEVIVDDRLPTRYGHLVYMHSAEKDEFWSALLEKAYAKLFGSYEALKGGSTSEAMEDFTGGITEMFDMGQKCPDNLFEIMQKSMKRCSLMGCAINADPNRVEARLPNGLVMGHAYSVTDIKQVEMGRTKIPLVRIRNPWGNAAEWTGAWSDSSSEWKSISQSERQRLGLSFDDDGEFWMSFKDFSSNFEKLEICHLGPDSLASDNLGGKSKRRWETCIENGGWKRRVNAGGCRNYLSTFWTNPQFRVEVVDPDEEDDENLGTIICGLMQKGGRKARKEGGNLQTIGYAIYQLNAEQTASQNLLDLNFFKYNASIAKSPSFINLREICGRHKLAPGNYVIIPSTFEPEQPADFLLRIFSERPNNSGELDEATGMVDVADAGPPADFVPQDERTTAVLRETFQKIAGEDMEIDAYELRDILNAAFKKGGAKGHLSLGDESDFAFDGFSIETCRSMVALMDCDQSGKLGFEEFQALWNDIRLWKTVFKKYDADRSGNFNSYELRQALNAVGFKVSNKVFNSLVMRYSSKKGVVLFDDYILCCVRLRTVFETYRAQDKDGRGNAIFSQDQFIQCIIYV